MIRPLALILALGLVDPALAQQQQPMPEEPSPEMVPERAEMPDMAPPADQPEEEAKAPVQPPPLAARSVPADFTALVQPLLPAVVNISSERTVPVPQQGQGPALPFPFGPPQMPDPNARRGTALGSGFILDPSGIVVTNAHVVEGSDQITVILHDERRFEAKVLGADERTDIAVLKIESQQPLPHVQWGDSEGVQVGEWILAIGNPYGLGGTVTSGIISATARNIGAGPYDAFLQTDAPINQGNSGGPMFNVRGQVIGINTAIFSPTGGNVGIGFAVPASLAKPVVEQLRETGTVRRGWLGVQIQGVNPEIAQALGLEQPRGALVSDVVPGSPAAEAGIQVGDVILTFNKQTLDDAHRLPLMVAQTPIGEQAQITLLREGKKQQVGIKVAELQAEPQQAAAGEAGELGLALGALTDPVRAKLGIPQGVNGALVQAVKPGSAAAQRGIRPGDVITMVAQQPVKGPQDTAEKVAEARKSERNSILILLRRGETQQFVTLPLPKEQVGERR